MSDSKFLWPLCFSRLIINLVTGPQPGNIILKASIISISLGSI